MGRKRAVLYARVSSEQQTDNTSLDGQLARCREYAQQHGYSVVGEFREEGRSGATTDRPELARLREFIRSGQADVCVVLDLDRFSRDTLDTLNLVKEFKGYGVELQTVSLPLEDSPVGQLVLFVEAWRGEQERDRIKERSVRGRQDTARLGKVAAGGRAPYGYRLVVGANRWEAVDEELKVVRLIFDRFLAEKSLRRIACELSDSGISTPTAAREWGLTSVRGILMHPVYTGRYAFGRHSGSNPSKAQSAKRTGKYTPVVTEPIVTENVPWLKRVVSDEEFEAVGRQFRRNKALSKRNRRREYLLAGYIVCGACGRPLAGHTDRVTRYYRCIGLYRLPGRVTEAERCSAKPLRADWLEGLVWGQLRDLIGQPALIDRMAAEAKQRLADSPEARAERELTGLERELSELAEKEERLLDLYLDGKLLKEKYEGRLMPMQDTKRKAEARLAELREQLAAREKVLVPTREELDRFARWMAGELDDMTYEEKRRLLELARITVEADRETVWVEGVLTGGMMHIRDGVRERDVTGPVVLTMEVPASGEEQARYSMHTMDEVAQQARAELRAYFQKQMSPLCTALPLPLNTIDAMNIPFALELAGRAFTVDKAP